MTISVQRSVFWGSQRRLLCSGLTVLWIHFHFFNKMLKCIFSSWSFVRTRLHRASGWSSPWFLSSGCAPSSWRRHWRSGRNWKTGRNGPTQWTSLGLFYYCGDFLLWSQLMLSFSSNHKIYKGFKKENFVLINHSLGTEHQEILLENLFLSIQLKDNSSQAFSLF